MIDLQRVEQLRIAAGIKKGEFARRLGMNVGNYAKIVDGAGNYRYEFVLRILQTLNVQLADIESDLPCVWSLFPLSWSERLQRFHEQLQQGRRVLTITQCLDSYLQDGEWMLEWSNRDWLGIDDWSVHRKLFLPYAEKQRQARNKARDMLHQLICPRDLFVAARHELPDWLTQVRHSMGAFEDTTCVRLVDDWKSLRKTIEGLLPKEAGKWEKICLVDDVTVLIHLPHRFYVCTTDPATVARLWIDLEDKLHDLISGFLPREEYHGTPFLHAAQETDDALARLLDKDPRPGKHWAPDGRKRLQQRSPPNPE